MQAFFKSRSDIVVVFFVLMLFASVSQAALHDRGSGLLYDDVLNVTWLQDANYAKTSGYSSDGVFLGYQALNWATDLVYHDTVRNVDYSDWRLPTVSPVGTNWNYDFSTDGSTDWGPNNIDPANELSYMYFVNLGLKSFISPDGSNNPDYGVLGNGATSGQADITFGDVTIKNLQAASYWTGTRWMIPENGTYYWTFVTRYGETNAAYEYTGLYAWAVRDGDVAAVPEPETYCMLLAGLSVIGLTARRRKEHSEAN